MTPLFSELLVIDDPVPRNGPVNMAMDEALLRRAIQPVLRIYRWNEASVSMGYFSRLRQALEFAQGRTVVRRWTGGGMVPHGTDLTYSLVISSSDASYRLSSPTLYQRVHEAIREALGVSGIRAVLAENPQPRGSAACFANPVTADLIESGRKIAGAAHRRTRSGLLHQGSIQHALAGPGLARQMATVLSATVAPLAVDPLLVRAAETLAQEKYATKKWLELR